ncbi:hypothetical protein [Salmonirosea aquatica]|uniref:Uncharacterized protein n=1 Tax=Salmonirosea aquatica TaxID=2654236 RepID=A0A7C9BM48_9BACT|nr:hypothetical protein [Cytophagaceae bacterium SJW1-29]
MLKYIVKYLKIIALSCLIILALCGVGFGGAGPISSQTKERYLDNEVKTEVVQAKNEESGLMQENIVKS